MSRNIKSIELTKFLDFTSLNESDTETSIREFCEQAKLTVPSVAAVCIYPQFVSLVKSLLIKTPINIATVINFPHGTDSISESCRAMINAIKDGADEIDAVIPYTAFLAGKQDIIYDYVNAYRKVCSDNILLKIILETGAFTSPELMILATQEAIRGGADFIKTSTGKISAGASLAAVDSILSVLVNYQPHDLISKPDNNAPIEADNKNLCSIGLKISGGIRTIEQAQGYIQLVLNKMGENWISPKTFRIGCSRLFIG